MAGDPPELHEQLEQLWRDIAKIDGDDSAARELLAAGHCIYYSEDDTPEELQIKEYPDGRRELVRFHREGDEVIRALPPDTAWRKEKQ
jgi:hypothetical protein